MFLLTTDSWEIKTTQKKGRGVYAKKDIAAGTVIGDYIGKVIKAAEEDTYENNYGLYLMYYNDQALISPTDVQAPGIHLINHSCAPNCWMYTYKGHTLYFAIRHIFAGEELTVAYLLGPDEDCNPCKHVCHCESKNCSHTMHVSEEQFDKWDAFEDAEAKKTKAARIRYGKELPKLASYPDVIPDDPIYSLFGSFEKSSLRLDKEKVPATEEIRRIIRETGRTIELTKLKTRILGVQDNKIISESI